MGLSRCYSLMKCLLIIFNIIFLLVGVGACVFSGWALWDGRGSETSAGRAGLCALVAWAAVLTLGALAALAGAIRGSASLLAGAFALLALSALAEGGAAWWGAAHSAHLTQMLRDRLRHTLTHDYGVLPARTQMLDAIQHGLQCCGAESTRDWQHAAWGGGLERDRSGETIDLSVRAPAAYYWVPRSCCSTADPEECESARRVVTASGGGAGLHGVPCGARVLDALSTAARAPLAAAGALLAAHAAALLLALALCLRAHPDTRYKA
ncbi:tetraspanin-11-like isoform X2 [Danaus plexippus]|uniref:tetraspanin-11-like isoform X2 n=1 Tax=Danaus plexippus TaxID=13037 RepID=UPI002AB18C51|nr:tetraspanin-11-like isoform X2 [Danaus plexippus]